MLLGTVDKLALIGHSPNTIRRIYGMFGCAPWQDIATGGLVVPIPNDMKDGPAAKGMQGLIPAYPNAFFMVGMEKLPGFVDAVSRLGSEADYAALASEHGIRRTDLRFWAHSDGLHAAWRRSAPREAGLLDYNRFDNR